MRIWIPSSALAVLSALALTAFSTPASLAGAASGDEIDASIWGMISDTVAAGDIVPFEALLVKKDGSWLILMERQLEATDENAWDELGR